MNNLNKGLQFDHLTLYYNRLILIVSTTAILALAKNGYFILVQQEIKLLYFVQCFD